MKKIAFTIVLNGMPFIPLQGDIIPEIFDEWHIIEGVVLPIKDTKWCKLVDPKFFVNQDGDYFGCSIDGTSGVIDNLKARYPEKIFVHRKKTFWNGKLDMCQCIEDRLQDAILMQIDVDEIWNKDKLREVLEFAENNEGFDGMIFKCNFYVGPKLVIFDEDTHPNKTDTWTRLWVIRDRSKWVSHEPPVLENLKTDSFLNKEFTSQKGWIFDHFAYLFESQLEFKENFYGYEGAKRSWQIMQKCPDKKFRLNRFFTWVDNYDMVSRIK
jgi:hypothetical protein